MVPLPTKLNSTQKQVWSNYFAEAATEQKSTEKDYVMRLCELESCHTTSTSLLPTAKYSQQRKFDIQALLSITLVSDVNYVMKDP